MHFKFEVILCLEDSRLVFVCTLIDIQLEPYTAFDKEIPSSFEGVNILRLLAMSFSVDPFNATNIVLGTK